jgi:hypothetical protein
LVAAANAGDLSINSGLGDGRGFAVGAAVDGARALRAAVPFLSVILTLNAGDFRRR